MPPRVPSHEALDTVQNAEGAAATVESHATQVDKVHSLREPCLNTETSKNTVNTFHYELNVYSFGLLGLVYYVLPQEYRFVMHILLALIAIDATKYYLNKGNMPGVPYTLPMVSLIAMVIHPTRFWTEMAAIAMKNDKDGMCCNTLVGNFLVFATEPSLCREIMTTVDVYGVYAHPNAMWLFGPKNLIYLEQERHKRFRAILTPALFSKEALLQYAEHQEKVVRRFLAKFASEGKTINLMQAFRSMAAASSQEAFLGPYLNDDMRAHLEEDILTFTMGFLCFPFPYLFGLRKAILAKNRIEATIRSIVPLARKYVQEGHAPRCMMEHWSNAILQAASEQNVDPQQVDCCHDDDMARTVLDFLFAAQDATNSALSYSLDVLNSRRDVLENMRAEIATEFGDSPIEGAIYKKIQEDHTDAFVYIGKVANQLLHYKNPVPMIPHITKCATTLGGHHIPKRSVVIPSITYSSRVSGHGLDFDPERPDQDHLFVKTVTFGAGQHKCPGRRYAESLLTVFLAVVAMDYDFSRPEGRARPSVDDFIYFPTIFPNDCEFLIFDRKKE